MAVSLSIRNPTNHSTVIFEPNSSRLLDRYDRLLIRYGIPSAFAIFAVIIGWFVLRGQVANAWLTMALLVLVIIVLVAPIGIDAARNGPWEK